MLADREPPLSRSRLTQLIHDGAVRDSAGAPLFEASRKVRADESMSLILPPVVAAEPKPEDVPLDVLFEDDAVIVVNKPVGMVVHPAPGAETGTLVNALLWHCGTSLQGIGGERRPGIVHRIDKLTSGALVAAKTEAALARLAGQFADHTVERRYLAVCWGWPDRADPRLAGLESVSFEEDGWVRIDTQIARHPTNRKRMAVARSGGRHAVTRLRVIERFGSASAGIALLECRLETGRTHQIRVHAQHAGHALVGDPVYGRARRLSARSTPERVVEAISRFPRQALHAETLGFIHPVTSEACHFEAPQPEDMTALLEVLRTW